MTGPTKKTSSLSSTSSCSRPLLRVGDINGIEQTLGGRTYRIDPSVVEEHAKSPVWKKAVKASVAVLASPILVPTAFLYTLSMYMGPSWWRNKMTAFLVGKAMKMVANIFENDRTELLKEIQPGALILDLGAGSGYYLRLFTKNQLLTSPTTPTTTATTSSNDIDLRLVALEPVPNFHENYRRLAREAGLKDDQVEVYSSKIETFVQDYPDRRATFDWIILGNVLCEVDDQISTLHCVNHLLKPGGHVYFSEHIASPPGTWKRRVQEFLNPFWRTAGGGCNCNRDSLENLRSMPGWQVISWHYHGFQVGLGPFVLGLALKNNDTMGTGQ